MDVDNRNMIIEMVEKLKLDSSEAEPLCQIWQVQRLKSLEDWPMVEPGAEKIAEAGFYRSPKSNHADDVVKCFSCFIELNGWEPSDKPWDEHRKRASSTVPPCKFIEIGKKESDFTLDDFLEIQKSVMIRIVQNKCKKSLEATLIQLKKKKRALKKDLQKLGMS